MPDGWFTSVTVWAAEGARVGLVTCLECGAAVLLDPRAEDNAMERHGQWHYRERGPDA